MERLTQLKNQLLGTASTPLAELQREADTDVVITHAVRLLLGSSVLRRGSDLCTAANSSGQGQERLFQRHQARPAARSDFESRARQIRH